MPSTTIGDTRAGATDHLPGSARYATDPAGSDVRAQGAVDALLAALDAADGDLSPEAVLMLAQRSIRDINLDVTASMNELSSTHSNAERVRTVLNAINANMSDPARQNNDSQIIDLRNDVDPRTGVTYEQMLRAAGVDVDEFTRERGAAGLAFTRQTTTQLTDSLRNNLQRITDSAESQGMRLQQLINRRGQITQLTSNVLQSMHETAKHIIGNTRG